MSIGTNIKKYRKANNLTQKELAEKIDKKERTVRGYEADDTIPPIDVIKKISNILDVPLSDLIRDNNKLSIEISDNDLINLKHENNFFFKPSEQDITLIYKDFINIERGLLIELIENINRIFCQSKYDIDNLIKNNDINYRDLSTLIENIISGRLEYYQMINDEKNNIINK